MFKRNQEVVEIKNGVASVDIVKSIYKGKVRLVGSASEFDKETGLGDETQIYPLA